MMAQQANSLYRSRREAERNDDWAYFVSESSTYASETEIHSDKKVTIRLEGYSSELKLSKAKLMAKSGFFRTMPSSNFQVRACIAISRHE